ncbi:hypothetical protein IQ266_23580 [filamentous cyanobacterium LEGE 11480]|uniref:Uncharacterized protein n=1 Tax=Romeriopsis navalis LEGE 11480 TaxID=2777977 RepID=A0A928VUE7_9CYAN|nr:hypothetical protein [Romeriopsis navalis LEGE 11480]
MKVLPDITGESKLTAKSARDIDGQANLEVERAPSPGLRVKLPVKPGEVLIVKVEVAIDQDTQRVLVDGGRLIVRVLPDSPALVAKKADVQSLTLAVEDILKDYQFNVVYKVDAVKPAPVTTWNMSLRIKVL